VQINRFVNDATNGNINSVVDEDQLDALTKLILVNAIYFKGKSTQYIPEGLIKDE
jgi:serpin B